MMQTAPASFGRQTLALWGSSDGKPGTSDGSLDIDAFLDSMLMRDPIGLNTELVPSALAQGLGLSMDALVGQQGSNGRKQGSGNRLAAALPRLGGGGGTLGVSGSVPHSAAPKTAAGQRNAAEAGLRGGQDDQDDIDVELALAQNQAAAAGAAAAQAAYAHQQQQAATAMAAAAQAYSHQQAAYAQQTQQAATAAAVAAANQPAASGMTQRHFYHQAQHAQAQAQQAAYLQAYQQQAAAHQAQAAAYVAATGQYPPGWIPNPYPGQYAGQYYAAAPQQYGQYSQGGGQYQSNVTGTAAGALAQQSAQQRQQQQQQAAAAAAAAAAALPPAAVVTAAAPATVAPITTGVSLDPTGALAAAAAAATLAGGIDATKHADDGDEARAVKRPRLIWTQALHRRFLESVQKCGGLDHAHPKAIMKEMGVDGLTRENVASHMQKYRMRLKKEEDVPSEYEAGGAGGHGDGEEEEGGAGDNVPNTAAEQADQHVGRKYGEEETPRKNNVGDGGGDGDDADVIGEGGVSKKTTGAGVGSKRKAAFDTAQAANNSAGTAL